MLVKLLKRKIVSNLALDLRFQFSFVSCLKQLQFLVFFQSNFIINLHSFLICLSATFFGRLNLSMVYPFPTLVMDWIAITVIFCKISFLLPLNVFSKNK